MKKKIGLGIVATLFVAGAVVLGSGTMKKASNCPDRPGCICATHTSAMQGAKTEDCANRPSCACTK
jgi:hypothetical protein